MSALLKDDEDEKLEHEFDFNQSYKVIFVGDSGIGKTSVINRFINDYFNQFNQATLQCSFLSKIVEIPNSKKQIKLQVWDTAGDEKFRNIVKMYYRGAHVVVICYDTTNEDSFDSLKTWISEIDQNINRSEAKVILCGCKLDLEDHREVETKDALIFAKENELKYFETSAKSGINIEYMFTQIAKMIYEDPPKQSKRKTVRITSQYNEESEEGSFMSKLFSFC